MLASNAICKESIRAMSLTELSHAVAKMDFGGVHSRLRDAVLPRYPSGTRKHLLRRYLQEANDRPIGLPGWSLRPWMTACERLQDRDRILLRARYGLAFDFDEIDLKARRCARMCRDAMSGKGALEGYKAAAAFAADQGVAPPSFQVRQRTVDSCRLRLGDPAWWRRKLKRILYRETEAVERDNGLVQAIRGLYASDAAVDRRQDDKARSRSFLEETFAVNSDGECVSLAEISDATISNPTNRKAEMMTRLSGFEDRAKQNGDSAIFITMTLPSRFHAYRRTGDRNQKYDGSDPLAGQDWLNTTWQRIRAKLHRLGIIVYGFRIAEPNHDGTPHWHMLLYVDPKKSEALVEVIREHMFRESPDETGAQEYRVTTIEIDLNTGSATGYLSKYVAKNIDGQGVGKDLEDSMDKGDASTTITRVETWASLWGIRQFQQIGGPPVGVWRELRRIREPLTGFAEIARLAADTGNWRTFIEVMQSGRISLAREWFDELGIYGEPIGMTTVGVICDGLTITTRTQEWIVTRDPEFAASRTCVNNCTPGPVRRSPDDCNIPPIVLDPTGPPIDCGQEIDLAPFLES